MSRPPTAPTVSVIIPAYNAAAFVGEAIDSALAQDYRPIEVVVVDDGSTDTTDRVVERYGSAVRLIRHPRNRGLPASRNTGIAGSRGELIAYLDADDAWEPSKLSRQVEALAARPDAALCHTGSTLFGGESGPGPIDLEVQRRIDGDCYDALFERNGVVVSSVLMPRACLPRGWFDEGMPVTADYAMWLRVLLDRPAVFLPDPLTRYRRHAAQMTADKGKRAQVEAGEARLRALDDLALRMSPQDAQRRRNWALEQLHTCTYSRYWNGDFEFADKGFRILEREGRTIPLRHRLRAAIGRKLGR